MNLRQKLACLFLHDWHVEPEGQPLYSRAGILAGSVEIGRKICKRCNTTKPVYRYGSLFKATKWLDLTPEVHMYVCEELMTLSELTEHNTKRDMNEVEVLTGQPCTCGKSKFRQIKADHGRRWWIGHERCPFCYKMSGAYCIVDKTPEELKVSGYSR